MGRTPHVGRFRPLGAEDRRAIEDAIGAAHLVELAERSVRELSGGERQRVMLARAFAQAAPLLVLDEPSANLDLLHAFELLELLRKHAEGGGAALVALHDLGSAARFADRVVVLERGHVFATGSAREVLSESMMREVFCVDARIVEDDGHVAVAVRGKSRTQRMS
jgi:iron complex transport system ATP-binding protein